MFYNLLLEFCNKYQLYANSETFRPNLPRNTRAIWRCSSAFTHKRIKTKCFASTRIGRYLQKCFIWTEICSFGMEMFYFKEFWFGCGFVVENSYKCSFKYKYLHEVFGPYLQKLLKVLWQLLANVSFSKTWRRILCMCLI